MNSKQFVNGILVFLLGIILISIGMFLLSSKSEGGDLDDHIRSSMYGVWKELHHQNCLEGESIVIYYPHMRFEEYTVYIANDNCEFVETGEVLKPGESSYRTTSGDWDVVDGYVCYITDMGKEFTKLKVLSMGTNKANFSWENGNTLKGYKIADIQ